jgi:hypothetical protein
MANPTLEREFGTLPATDPALGSAPVPAAAAPSGDPTMSIGGTGLKTVLLLILTVTIIWLYIEILRLLGKTRN